MSYLVGMILLLTMGLTFIVGAPAMLFGVVITPYHFVLGYIASVIVCRCFSTTRDTVIALLISLFVISISICVACNVYDGSWDGNTYHQETINALAFESWNPYLSQDPGYGISLWSMHYAKGIEWLAACVASMMNCLESGKAINFILLSAIGFISWAFVTKRYPNLRLSNKIILTILVVGNPVAIMQMFTFYIDFAFYCYLVLTIVFSLEIIDGQNLWSNYIGLIVTIVLAIATKFNAFFMEGVAIFVIILGVLIYRRKQLREDKVVRCGLMRFILVVVLATIIGACVVCYYPYITNWISNGNPLYPLMGQGSIDIMTSNTPGSYLVHNRLMTFISSIFALRYPAVDLRIGGFGPLFSVAFSIGVVYNLYKMISTRRIPLECFIFISLFASCMLFEQSWWARYNTQLWLAVPVLYLVFTQQLNNKRIWLRRIYGFIAIANVMICVAFAVYNAAMFTVYKNAIYSVFADAPMTIMNVPHHHLRQLSEHNIAVNIIDEQVGFVPKSRCLIYVDTVRIGAYPWVEVSDEQNEKIDSIYENHPINTGWQKGIHVITPITNKIWTIPPWKR
jgi:hypothetical protein